MSNTYTFWNFAGDHPFLLFFCVLIVSLSAVDISGNIAKAFRRGSRGEERVKS